MDLDEVARGVGKLLQRLMPSNIDLSIDTDGKLWPANVDGQRLEQVVVNLVLNARDASPDGGTITLHTANVELDEDARSAGPMARPGRFVRLQVADTGAGMTPEVMARIFEPFYTTKPRGKGTGLGLAMVYGIGEQHGGWVTVDSDPSRGSRFSGYLPATPEAQRRETRRQTSRPLMSGAGERILLVEDEPVLLRLAGRVLEGAGYRVTSTASAEEAEAALADAAKDLDLLVTDVVLPGRSGVELAETLLSARPDTPVLLCSGYLDRDGQWESICERGVPLLRKPYDAAQLLRAVEHALGGPVSGQDAGSSAETEHGVGAARPPA